MIALLGSVELRVALLILFGWASTRVLASRSAALRHGVWTATIIGALAVPAAHLLLPALRAPIAIPAAAWMAQAIGPRRAGTSTFSEQAPRPSSDSPARRSALDGSDAVSSVPARPAFEIILTLAWLLGAIALLARMAAGSWSAHGIVRSAVPVDDAALTRSSADLSARAGLSRPPVLLETAAIDAPATFGVLRPVVLLPITRPWSADSDEARAVLAHEIAHVARHDCLTHAVSQLACAMHWFNPLVWVAERRMRVERERACDDRVLAEGAVADRYAEFLVAVVRGARRSAPLPASVIAMAHPSEFEARVVALLDPVHDRRAVGRRGASALAVVATVVGALASVIRLDAAPVERVARLDGAPVAGVVRHDVPPPASAARRNAASVARVVADPSVAQSQSQLPRRTEPDTRADSLALPGSERLDPASVELAESRSRAALVGADSMLARSLRAMLTHRSNGTEDLVRERAMWALARTRDGLLVEPLIESLGDANWRVRAYAAWTLGVARDARAVPALIAQLRDPVWRMRAMAANALAEIGDGSARAAMEPLEADEAWQVRYSVVRYFRLFDDEHAKALVRRAENDRHVAVRSAAVSG